MNSLSCEVVIIIKKYWGPSEIPPTASKRFSEFLLLNLEHGVIIDVIRRFLRWRHKGIPLAHHTRKFYVILHHGFLLVLLTVEWIIYLWFTLSIIDNLSDLRVRKPFQSMTAFDRWVLLTDRVGFPSWSSEAGLLPHPCSSVVFAPTNPIGVWMVSILDRWDRHGLSQILTRSLGRIMSWMGLQWPKCPFRPQASQPLAQDIRLTRPLIS